MTDKELLELAAKAAGLELDWDVPDGASPWVITGEGADRGPGSPWDPLNDDGDALRLAVTLCMNVEVTDSYVFACSVGNFSEPAKPDRNAAVRRAIVRAAAAMASNGETV